MSDDRYVAMPNEDLNELMSAVIDDEASPAECKRVFDALENDPELCQQWERLNAQRAKLSGLTLAPQTEQSWRQIYLSAQTAKPKRAGTIIRFNSLRNVSLTQWVGSTALAASVLLVASLFVVTVQPGFGDKGQYALEADYATPTIADFTPRDATSSARRVQQVSTAPANPRPQFAVADKAADPDIQMASGIDENEEERLIEEAVHRRVPVHSPRPNNVRPKLVRWASDRR